MSLSLPAKIYAIYIVRNTYYELINNLIARDNEKGEYDREDTTRNNLQKIKKKLDQVYCA